MRFAYHKTPTLKENNIYFHFNKKKLLHNFQSYQKIGRIYYPLKTNSNQNVLNYMKSIFRKTDGFLISNLDQFQKLMAIKMNPNRICYINVLAEKETVKYLYDQKVRSFVFDNIDSLKHFGSYANLSECKIMIRLNTMEVFKDSIMHLGSNTNDALIMLNYLKSRCKSYGISFYLQTNIKNEEQALKRMLNYITKEFNNTDISFISIAGIKEASEIDLEYLKNIKRLLNITEIILEPGKYLIGNTINMQTKIIRTKELKDQTVVIIKNGLYSGFLDILLYHEKFELYLKLKNGDYIEFKHEKTSEFDYAVYICGGSSDSGDIIGTMYIDNKYKEELKINREIVVKNIGAYFEEFFMAYGCDINKVYIEEE